MNLKPVSLSHYLEKTRYVLHDGRPVNKNPIDDELKKEMLRQIELSGSVSQESAIAIPIVSRQETDLLDKGNGLPRIKHRLAAKFQLILGQPLALKILNPFEIRCCLCHQVISYPAWYWTQKFNINQFHYFVCFDSHSPGKVTAKCYRR